MQVAPAAQVQVHAGPEGRQGQHVIQHAEAGLDIGRARAVQGEAQADFAEAEETTEA